MTKRGCLIVVEGVSRAGKSTLVDLMLRKLNVGHLSEWNSDPRIKPMTDQLKKELALTPASFSLIHLLDFDQRYHRGIAPALARGGVVLCDRYLPTATARDLCRGVDLVPALRALYRDPDVCIYVEPDFDLVRQRFLADRGKYGYYGLGTDVLSELDDVERFLAYQRKQHEHYVRHLRGPQVLHWNAHEDSKAEALVNELELRCPAHAFRQSHSTE